ncbi:MAG: DUF296 domain-containing protein [Planctomycetota bacterium]
MFYREFDESVFVRLDPGDPFVESIERIASLADMRTGFLCSGVGMLSDPVLGFFDVERDDYDVTELRGTFDLNAVHGNVTLREGSPAAHVHVVFNDRRHKLGGGHLIEAKCHITAELLLVRTDGLGLERLKLDEHPATRICPLAGFRPSLESTRGAAGAPSSG